MNSVNRPGKPGAARKPNNATQTGKRPGKSRPAAILLSKRAAVVYLEHARVLQKDGRVLYLMDGGDAEQMFMNIPFRNTAVLLLGKGTSITDSAARLLAESGVLIGFCGSGGSPLFSGTDPTLLSPQSEYRPTEYMQAWMRMWLDDAKRLDLAKRLLRARMRLAEEHWAKNPELARRQVFLPEDHLRRFESRIRSAADTTQLLLAEAEWVKGLYRFLAIGYRMADFRREEQPEKRSTVEQLVNSMRSHGNYIAYGYAAATLYTMGVSFALPVLHGKTRRGGLVFDLADLVKDWAVLPHAFSQGFQGNSDQEYRTSLIDAMQSAQVLDTMFETFKDLCA